MEFLHYVQVQLVIRDLGSFHPTPVPSGDYAGGCAALEVPMETLGNLIGYFQRPGLDVVQILRSPHFIGLRVET